ncbi:hypothetical protein BKA93DRAFT_877062 [Sparassis latifolia]
MTLGHGDKDDMGVERGLTGNARTLRIPAAQSTGDKISHALMRAQGLIHRRKYMNMAGAVTMAKCNPGHGAVNMSSRSGLRTCWLPVPTWRARALAVGDASGGKDMGRRRWVTGRQHYVRDGDATTAALGAGRRRWVRDGGAGCGTAVLDVGLCRAVSSMVEL